MSPVLKICKTVFRLDILLVFCSPQDGRGVGFRPPRELLQSSDVGQNIWSAPLLSGTMIGTGFMNFILLICTFNNIVLIVWRK